jgi:hypothetical protein
MEKGVKGPLKAVEHLLPGGKKLMEGKEEDGAPLPIRKLGRKIVRQGAYGPRYVRTSKLSVNRIRSGIAISYKSHADEPQSALSMIYRSGNHPGWPDFRPAHLETGLLRHR